MNLNNNGKRVDFVKAENFKKIKLIKVHRNLSSKVDNSEISMYTQPPPSPITINEDTLNTAELLSQLGHNTPIVASTHKKAPNLTDNDIFNTAEILFQHNTPGTSSTHVSKTQNKTIPGHVERLFKYPSSRSPENQNALLDTEVDAIIGNSKQHQQQQKSPNLIVTPELKYISRQLASIKLDITQIVKYLKPANAFSIDLPIQSQKQLEEIISKIKDDEFSQNLTKHLTVYAPVNGKHHCTGLSKIITDSVLKDYNWDGLNFKLPLKDIVLFNKILFEAWKVKFTEYAQYEKSIKKQIFDSHNRENRRKNRAAGKESITHENDYNC